MASRGPDPVKWIASRLTRRHAHPHLVRVSSRLHLMMFRIFGGTGMFGINTLVLTTRGRVTGRPRSTPVNYVEQGGVWFIAASFAGNDTPPRWYLNLRAHPDVVIEVGARRIACTARVLTDDEAASVWPALIAMDPLFTAYRARVARRIPLVALAPAHGAVNPGDVRR